MLWLRQAVWIGGLGRKEGERQEEATAVVQAGDEVYVAECSELSVHPAGICLLHLPEKAFLTPPTQPLPAPLPQPITLWVCLLGCEQLESPASPHPGPGLQEVSRKARQMDPTAPPSRAAHTATRVLFACVPTDRHRHSFASGARAWRAGREIWGQEAV